MIYRVSLDQYLEIKEDIKAGIAIFQLDSQPDNLVLAELEHDIDIYCIRMSEEDFHMMDMGVSPKTLAIVNGVDKQEFNGLPNRNQLEKIWET